jgi:hypothetical protein
MREIGGPATVNKICIGIFFLPDRHVLIGATPLDQAERYPDDRLIPWGVQLLRSHDLSRRGSRVCILRTNVPQRFDRSDRVQIPVAAVKLDGISSHASQSNG